MPGLGYHRIAVKVSKWLSVVEECQIQSSAQSIAKRLQYVEADDNKVLVSVNVPSLYTNFAVLEAGAICTNL